MQITNELINDSLEAVIFHEIFLKLKRKRKTTFLYDESFKQRFEKAIENFNIISNLPKNNPYYSTYEMILDKRMDFVNIFMEQLNYLIKRPTSFNIQFEFRDFKNEPFQVEFSDEQEITFSSSNSQSFNSYLILSLNLNEDKINERFIDLESFRNKKKNLGNENRVSALIFKNLNQFTLPHLGKIQSLGNPTKSGIENITTLEDLKNIKSSAPQKKADIYLNNIGISVKESPSANLYNRLQLEGLAQLFKDLKIENASAKIGKLNKLISDYHNGHTISYNGQNIKGRNFPWQIIFTEEEFKKLLKYLAMDGSLVSGVSHSPAKFILEAPKNISNVEQLNLYTFDEYFDKYKDNNIVIAVRRCWYGQASKEHNRAKGLMSKIEHQPWVFSTISGAPLGWRDDIAVTERKTIYYCMIEKRK